MVARDRQIDFVITKFECEFAAAQKLFVLPARIIRIGGQTREPLRHTKDVIVFFGEIFIAPAASNRDFVQNIMFPIDLDCNRFAGLERFGQINPHHRVIDRIGQGVAILIHNRCKLKAVSSVFFGLVLS